MPSDILPDRLELPDKTAVYVPTETKSYIQVPESIEYDLDFDEVEVKPQEAEKKMYNFDYDEDVDAFKQDMELHSDLKAEYNNFNKGLKYGAEADSGFENSKLFYPALMDAMDKKDPVGFRASGRKGIIPNEDIRPDFGFEAVEGEDDTDKKYSYEGLLGEHKNLYPKNYDKLIDEIVTRVMNGTL